MSRKVLRPDGSPVGEPVLPENGIPPSTTALVPAVIATGTDLAQVPTALLREELARGLTMTAVGLSRMSVVWQELERRGDDLSDLREGMALYLPDIASGRLAAEAVVQFASRPSCLHALQGVPLEEQRRLAAGGKVAVVDPADQSLVELPLRSIPRVALGLVFSDGTVRTPALQRIAMQARLNRPRRQRATPAYLYRPRYDPDTGTFTVGKMTVRLADMLSALSAAAGPDLMHDLPAEEYVTVKARLTRDESAQFLALCQRLDLPEWELLRKAMRAFALLSRGSGG